MTLLPHNEKWEYSYHNPKEPAASNTVQVPHVSVAAIRGVAREAQIPLLVVLFSLPSLFSPAHSLRTKMTRPWLDPRNDEDRSIWGRANLESGDNLLCLFLPITAAIRELVGDEFTALGEEHEDAAIGPRRNAAAAIPRQVNNSSVLRKMDGTLPSCFSHSRNFSSQVPIASSYFFDPLWLSLLQKNGWLRRQTSKEFRTKLSYKASSLHSIPVPQSGKSNKMTKCKTCQALWKYNFLHHRLRRWWIQRRMLITTTGSIFLWLNF